jgi:hypothetical protein
MFAYINASLRRNVSKFAAEHLFVQGTCFVKQLGLKMIPKVILGTLIFR